MLTNRLFSVHPPARTCALERRDTGPGDLAHRLAPRVEAAALEYPARLATWPPAQSAQPRKEFTQLHGFADELKALHRRIASQHMLIGPSLTVVRRARLYNYTLIE